MIAIPPKMPPHPPEPKDKPLSAVKVKKLEEWLDNQIKYNSFRTGNMDMMIDGPYCKPYRAMKTKLQSLINEAEDGRIS